MTKDNNRNNNISINSSNNMVAPVERQFDDKYNIFLGTRGHSWNISEIVQTLIITSSTMYYTLPNTFYREMWCYRPGNMGARYQLRGYLLFLIAITSQFSKIGGKRAE